MGNYVITEIKESRFYTDNGTHVLTKSEDGNGNVDTVLDIVDKDKIGTFEMKCIVKDLDAGIVYEDILRCHPQNSATNKKED